MENKWLVDLKKKKTSQKLLKFFTAKFNRITIHGLMTDSHRAVKVVCILVLLKMSELKRVTFAEIKLCTA